MITEKAKFTDVFKNVYLRKKSPISLIHFLTNRCNARCSFCFIDFDNPNSFKNELTLDEIDKLTKNLGNTLLNVNFTGGEPFARKVKYNLKSIAWKEKKKYNNSISLHYY